MDDDSDENEKFLLNIKPLNTKLLSASSDKVIKVDRGIKQKTSKTVKGDDELRKDKLVDMIESDSDEALFKDPVGNCNNAKWR